MDIQETELIGRNMIDDLISTQLKKLTSEKQRLVELRIKEKTGLEIDLNKEKLRTFPRIAVMNFVNHAEQWYWNDGSVLGLLLITIYPYESIEYKGNKNTCNVGFKYA